MLLQSRVIIVARMETMTMTLPMKIPVLDAARIINLPIGLLARDLKAKCFTGQEPVPTAKIMKHYKIPARLFARLLSGDDRLLNRTEAAALLNVKRSRLNAFQAVRPLIVPAINAGPSPWGGNRYALSSVKAQIELDRLAPPAPRGMMCHAQHLPLQPQEVQEQSD